MALWSDRGVAEISDLENGFEIEFYVVDEQEPGLLVIKRLFCPDAGALAEALGQAVSAYPAVRALRRERMREQHRNPPPRDDRPY